MSPSTLVNQEMPFLQPWRQMPKEVRQAHTEETVSASGAHRWCVSVLSVLKFTSFTFLSAISLPETPDYVHSPPPQQEVNIRTQEVVYSLAEMP